MQRQITINATQARKNFFELLQDVIENDKEIMIKKKGLDELAVLKRKKVSEVEKRKQIARDRKIVRELAGSVKSKISYQPDEMKLAEKIFVEEYKEKYGIK